MRRGWATSVHPALLANDTLLDLLRVAADDSISPLQHLLITLQFVPHIDEVVEQALQPPPHVCQAQGELSAELALCLTHQLLYLETELVLLLDAPQERFKLIQMMTHLISVHIVTKLGRLEHLLDTLIKQI